MIKKLFTIAILLVSLITNSKTIGNKQIFFKMQNGSSNELVSFKIENNEAELRIAQFGRIYKLENELEPISKLKTKLNNKQANFEVAQLHDFSLNSQNKLHKAISNYLINEYKDGQWQQAQEIDIVLL
ncbi:hypothetical protein GF322_02340, partial [Candidatus Dependentiae bacterium]|nr:hypothetical protein [Candidatus Dependentiae bacterium]